MRRIRRVTIKVSQGFYDILNNERARLSRDISKKIGFQKNVSILAVTEFMAQRMNSDRKGRIGHYNEKQKRRCI